MKWGSWAAAKEAQDLERCFVCREFYDPNAMLTFTIAGLSGAFFSCGTHPFDEIRAGSTRLMIDTDYLELDDIHPYSAKAEADAMAHARAEAQSAQLTVGNGRAPIIHRGTRPPLPTAYDPCSILEEAEREADLEDQITELAESLGVPRELLMVRRSAHWNDVSVAAISPELLGLIQ